MSNLQVTIAPDCEGQVYQIIGSEFDAMLQLAERRFGARDPLFTVLDIKFWNNVPQTDPLWKHKRIVIFLGPEAQKRGIEARFQLAHECIHLLNPVLIQDVTVLEEGIATNFSLEYVHRYDRTYGLDLTKEYNKKYDAANRCAAKLLCLCPDSVKMLRSKGVPLSSISASQLRDICPELSSELANVLTTQFQSWKGNT
jgi:hypothetical protein